MPKAGTLELGSGGYLGVPHCLGETPGPWRAWPAQPGRGTALGELSGPQEGPGLVDSLALATATGPEVPDARAFLAAVKEGAPAARCGAMPGVCVLPQSLPFV